MKKQKKLALRLLVLLAVLVLAAGAGYLAVFHNADVLKIENGKALGEKPTWLIGRFAEKGGAEQYYKVADVGTPKGYAALKDAPDTDNDPITTAFVFIPKGQTHNVAGTYDVLITVQAVAAQEIQGQAVEIGGVPGYSSFVQGADAAQARFLMDSPYADAKIEILATLPAGTDEAEMTALIAAMAEKVTLGKQLSPFAADFKLNFLDDARWKYLWNGLGVTLEITLFAVLIGIAIGTVVAAVRSTWEQAGETMRRGPGKTLLAAINGLCKVYLTVIRGTPVVIQLMIMYYIIFASSRNGVLIAILAFGINSGAYVAEIFRGGIESIDKGQLEAGRSLGFNYVQTMGHIIVPQALKNVLPALANEFIVLLKETSVAGYVAVKDLTKGGDIIRGVTYSAFMPLLAVAAIYLIMVMFFTWLVGKLERRLRSSDH